MSPRFLLDTNVLSERLRPVPDARILRRMREHEAEIVTAAPVLHELVFGCSLLPRSSRRRKAIEEYVEAVIGAAIPILPYDAAAAKWHGRERARLAQEGIPPSFVDGQIAAIASVNGLEVVTSNVRDFEAFEGVTVRDWRA